MTESVLLCYCTTQPSASVT